MTDLPTYVLDRVFDAPRNLVWKAWTDPGLLHRWYGPNAVTTIHKYDLRPGGVWLNEMNWGGKADYSRMDFVEVVPLERLVWSQASTDKDWSPASNPMMPDWPRLLLTTVLFADDGLSTKVHLTQTPVKPTDSEIACFAKFMARMDSGWGSGYIIQEEILRELKAELSGSGT